MNKFHQFYRVYLPLPIVAAKRNARDSAMFTQYVSALRPLVQHAEAVLGQVLLVDEGLKADSGELILQSALFSWVAEQTALLKEAAQPLRETKVWCKYVQAVLVKQMETFDIVLQGLEKLTTLYLGIKNRFEEDELEQLLGLAALTLMQDALEADNRRIEAYIDYSRDMNPKRYEQEARKGFNNANLIILHAYSDALSGNLEALQSAFSDAHQELDNAEQCIGAARERLEPYFGRMEKVAARPYLKEEIRSAMQNLASMRAGFEQGIDIVANATRLQRQWLLSEKDRWMGIGNKEEARLQLSYVCQQLYLLAYKHDAIAEQTLKTATESAIQLNKIY